jgi:nucleotide-binding universal stress UspA family protein
VYKGILVPIDARETAALGLNEAIRLAKNQSAAIRLVHIVNELIVVLPYESGFGLSRVIDILRSGGESMVDARQDRDAQRRHRGGRRAHRGKRNCLLRISDLSGRRLRQ